MKRLLLLLLTVTLFFSCDNNHDLLTEEYIEQHMASIQYMASIMDACDDGTRTSYCISKEEWVRLMDELGSKPEPSASCGGRWPITFKDKGGIERTGFSDGVSAGPNECTLNM